MRASIFWRRLLRTGLVTGGLLDLLLAGVLLGGFTPPAVELFEPRRSAVFYRLTESPEAILVAVLLVGLGLTCLAAANEPRRHWLLVSIAGGERLALAATLALAVRGGTGKDTLMALALAQAALGLAHLLPRWRLGR